MAKILPNNFPIPANDAVASYSFEDLVTRLGYTDFYAAISQDDDYKYYNLLSFALPSADTRLEYVAGDLLYMFSTSPFNLPRTIKGKAYVSGSVNSSSGNADGIITILKANDPATYTLGSSIASDTNETSTTSATLVTVKTFSSINARVWKIVVQAKHEGGVPGQGAIQFIFNYADGSQTTTGETPLAETYTEYSSDTVHRDKLMESIEIQLKRGSAGTAYVDEMVVYGVGNVDETTICSATALESLGNAGILLVGMDTTPMVVKRGDIIILKLEYVGGASTVGYVIDPTAAVYSTPTLKLSMPFKVET